MVHLTTPHRSGQIVSAVEGEIHGEIAPCAGAPRLEDESSEMEIVDHRQARTPRHQIDHVNVALVVSEVVDEEVERRLLVTTQNGVGRHHREPSGDVERHRRVRVHHCLDVELVRKTVEEVRGVIRDA